MEFKVSFIIIIGLDDFKVLIYIIAKIDTKYSKAGNLIFKDYTILFRNFVNLKAKFMEN